MAANPNDYNSFIIYLRVVILVSTPMLWGERTKFYQNISYQIIEALQIQDGSQNGCQMAIIHVLFTSILVPTTSTCQETILSYRKMLSNQKAENPR